MSGFHYKKDGTLDMRYNSSKRYVSSGGSVNGPSYESSSQPSSNNSFSRPQPSRTSNFSSNYNNYSSNYGNNSSNYGNYSSKFGSNSTNYSGYEAVSKTSTYARLNNDNTINRTSQAVRSGELKFKKDGSVDKRCKAVKQQKVILDSNDQVAYVKSEPPSFSQSKLLESSPFTTTRNFGSSLFTSDDIKINKDGTINKNSKAVKDGSILFTQDGKIDRRSSAVKQNKIILNSNGQVDLKSMNLYPSEGQKSSNATYASKFSRNRKFGFQPKSSVNFALQPDPFESISDQKVMSVICDLTNSFKSGKFGRSPTSEYDERSVNIEPEAGYDSDYTIEEEEKNESKKESDSDYSIEEKEDEKKPNKSHTQTKTQNPYQYTKDKPLIRKRSIKPKLIKQEDKIENSNEDSDDSQKESDDQTERSSNNKNQETHILPKQDTTKSFINNTKSELSTKSGNPLDYDQIFPKFYFAPNYKNSERNDRPLTKPKEAKKTRKKQASKRSENRPVSKKRSSKDKRSQTIVASLVLLFLFLIFYTFFLSKIHLHGERSHLNKFPYRAVCDFRQVENETIITVNRCQDNYLKLENGFIQICSPENEPKLSEYKDTLMAASYLSKVDGDCFFRHERNSLANLRKMFPRVDGDLLQRNEDFLTVMNDNNEYKSVVPQYNAMCRLYKNAAENYPTQTLVIFVFACVIFYYGFNILFRLK